MFHEMAYMYELASTQTGGKRNVGETPIAAAKRLKRLLHRCGGWGGGVMLMLGVIAQF